MEGIEGNTHQVHHCAQSECWARPPPGTIRNAPSEKTPSEPLFLYFVGFPLQECLFLSTSEHLVSG